MTAQTTATFEVTGPLYFIANGLQTYCAICGRTSAVNVASPAAPRKHATADIYSRASPAGEYGDKMIVELSALHRQSRISTPNGSADILWLNVALGTLPESAGTS